MFVVPCSLMHAMALLGKRISESSCLLTRHRAGDCCQLNQKLKKKYVEICLGMFSPGSSTQERDRKIDIGLTALLTMSIILLMLVDMIPRTSSSSFPWLGVWVQKVCVTWVCSQVNGAQY
jgi:hypothetical protein